jgi:hypothetical protein
MTTPDTIVFKSNSADKKPGKGVHEFVADATTYATLAAIKDFRRYLSNFDTSVSFSWQGPFTKPNTFRSIEHAFQAAKIYIADPTEALKFTVESGDAIGAGDGIVARKHRKLVKLSKTQLVAWDSISLATMASIAESKYTQNSDSVAATVLKATSKAHLVHIETVRGKSSNLIRFIHLETIRDTLLSSA